MAANGVLLLVESVKRFWIILLRRLNRMDRGFWIDRRSRLPDPESAIQNPK
jgi:hypothetical protein